MTSSPGAEERYLESMDDAPADDFPAAELENILSTSSTDPEERILDAPPEGFPAAELENILSTSSPGAEERYLEGMDDAPHSDPQVTIRIGSPSREYTLSKTLLCKESPYFAAIFTGDEQSTTLTEIDDVVSVRSLESLIRWLDRGRVSFGALTPKETITAAIEFARFADMCGVTGIGTLMAEHIKATIIYNPPPDHLVYPRTHDFHTYHITPKHILSGVCLPEEHPVRRMLAAAAVEGYIQDDTQEFSNLLEEVQECVFASDLLKAVRRTLKSVDFSFPGVCVSDPLTGKDLRLL